MKRKLSITLRLTLLFAAASAWVLALLGALVIRLVDGHFEELDVDELNGHLVLISKSMKGVTTITDLERLGLVLSDLLVGHEQLSMAVMDSSQRLLFSTTAVEFPDTLRAPADAVSGQLRGPVLVWSSGGRHYRGMSAAVATGMAGHPPVTVALAVNIGSHMAFVEQFERSLLSALAGSTVLIALLSWFTAHRGLAPIHEVARLAKRISADRIGDRLPISAVPAEIVDLALAFNDMLDRLGDSFRRMSEFSSDVAHELRTPISNVMTQTQVALSAERSPPEYREVLHSILEEHERMARMVGDMLYLSKAENGILVPSSADVDLAHEVRLLCAYFDALVEERGVQLRVYGEGVVRGDRLMLRRAISNLLSNAIRHTASGGAVEVRIESKGSGIITLSVENPGPDIPAEHLPRLFDRFYQVDASRKKSGKGAGLGLAIVRSIATAHGASIRVESSRGRTRFVIDFGERALRDLAARPAA